MTVHQNRDYEAALQKLSGWQDDLAGDHQRRFRRFPVNANATLGTGRPETESITTAESTGEPRVPVRDISRGGMSALVDHPVPIGTLWQIHLDTDGVVVSTVTGVCRFCRCVEGAVHLVGVEFGVDAALLRSFGVGLAELAEGDRSETELTSGLPARPAS
ncbi:MAG: PilZ domain-containing protein [Phycisphaerales bacterium]|nr:PilZ domain-containing protein [Phycisphaerae bacterium]NNF43804.1 PilZ domain-containing protein [Phycisphaerales bacterium]NNM27210.1 PilZ domain-containing protein [Phycisphaerales bacterium]